MKHTKNFANRGKLRAVGPRLSLIVAVALAVSNAAFAADPKMAKDLDGVAAETPVDVIVQFTQIPTGRHQKLVTDRGGVLKDDLSLVKAGHYVVPASALADLANQPEVVYISPNRPVQSLLDIANPTVNANLARAAGYTGTGIGIALIDSGVQANNDLQGPSSLFSLFPGSRIVYSQNFTADADSTDGHGHGTHVAGVLAGGGNQSTGLLDTRSFIGIAPNANIVNLKVLDHAGAGSDSTVIAGIQEAIALKTKYNIRVINLSLGRPVYESYKLDPICQAVEAAWKAGIVVVAAAGNDGRDNTMGTSGYGTITVPGNDPYVITVGAMKDEGTITRTDDKIASYSSKGPTQVDHIVKPDIVAPGNLVISLMRPSGFLSLFSSPTANEIPLSYYQFLGLGTSSVYYRLSGTSIAAPMVSGAAALLLQQNANLTPDQVKARLMLTATKASRTIPPRECPTPASTTSSPSAPDIWMSGPP